jgi:hypothetical protein
LQSFKVETLKAVHLDLDNVLVVIKLCHEDAICVELPVRNPLAPCVPQNLEELLRNHGDVVLTQVPSLLANEWQEAWRIDKLTDQGHLVVAHEYVLEADDSLVLQLQELGQLVDVVFPGRERRISDILVGFVILQEGEKKAFLN